MSLKVRLHPNDADKLFNAIMELPRIDDNFCLFEIAAEIDMTIGYVVLDLYWLWLNEVNTRLVDLIREPDASPVLREFLKIVYLEASYEMLRKLRSAEQRTERTKQLMESLK